MKVASEAKVNYVVFNGCEGGTGMSPVPMMNEQGTPTVYLEAQVLKCCEMLRRKAKYGERFKEIPWGAVGLYTYIDKMRVGLQQLMAGARKWKRT
jgi:hypothetical protein